MQRVLEQVNISSVHGMQNSVDGLLQKCLLAVCTCLLFGDIGDVGEDSNCFVVEGAHAGDDEWVELAILRQSDVRILVSFGLRAVGKLIFFFL